jgi:hypothetical protein
MTIKRVKKSRSRTIAVAYMTHVTGTTEQDYHSRNNIDFTRDIVIMELEIIFATVHDKRINYLSDLLIRQSKHRPYPPRAITRRIYDTQTPSKMSRT